MQLFRVDGNGVKPLPAVSALLQSAQATSPAGTSAATAAAQPPVQEQVNGWTAPESPKAKAPAAANTSAGTLLAQADGSMASLQVLSQSFTGPLPPNLSGNIRLVSVAEDGTLGNIVEEIPFDSPNVSFSPDRSQLIVRPSSPIAPGQSVMMQLPSRSLSGIRFVYPNHLVTTPCIFKATAVSGLPAAGAPLAGAPTAGTAAAATAAPAAAAAASTIPIWAIVAGIVVVGVGVAAASGAFSNGGGGGGTSPSSQ